jgi:acetyl esterase/lipase
LRSSDTFAVVTAQARCGAICALLAMLLLAPKGVVAAEPAMPVSFDAVLSLSARAADARVAYGSSGSQVAELWLPRGGGPAPVVMLLHGGCWLAAYSAAHVYPLAARLAHDGYAVWVPEYRRSGEPGGGYPGTFADVERALVALTTEDRPDLDLQRVLLVGHSAGGHLALWLAGRDPALLPPALSLVGAVGLAPITDLASYAAGANSCQSATVPFVGATPEQAPELYNMLSPATRSLYARAVLLRGSEDGIVGAEQIAAMVEGRQVGAVELPGAGHFDWIHPHTEAYRTLRRTLEDLLTAGAPTL